MKNTEIVWIQGQIQNSNRLIEEKEEMISSCVENIARYKQYISEHNKEINNIQKVIIMLQDLERTILNEDDD